MSTSPRPIQNFVSQNYFHVLDIHDEEINNLSTEAVLKGTSVLPIKLLHETATLPTKGSKEAAGYDLYAAEEAVIAARQRGLVDTKLAMALPKGTYGRIAPRSGLAVKKNVDIGAGVIDADYRGSVKVLLINSSDEELRVKKGERVAQLIVEKIEEVEILQTENLDQTGRGEKGFGSTGIAKVGERKKESSKTKLEIVIGLKTTDTGEGDNVKALIDSGATGLFIDESYVQGKQWQLEDLERSNPVYNVDGTLNAGGNVRHTIELLVRFQEHQERAVFTVTKLSGAPVILGHAWLKNHNPKIDWKKGGSEVNEMSACL